LARNIEKLDRQDHEARYFNILKVQHCGCMQNSRILICE